MPSTAPLDYRTAFDLAPIGLVLSRNGAARGAPVTGEDFYAALLRCFIGVRPADAEMKIGLLGGPVG